ncbi:MAG TPA: hypothetical protein VFX98_06140 [Longimicrobiaceae bacterium]|nr:hypothetical protein [Longimicrobiaceae bacterium]
MTPPSRPCRVVLLALALAAGGAPLAGQTAFTTPNVVGEFRATGSEDLKPGQVTRYTRGRDRDFYVDVYVYPFQPDSGCAAGCDSVAVRKEADDFVNLIPQLLERRYYDSLRVVSDEAIELPSGSGVLRGRYLRLTGGMRGRAVTSHYYLLGAGDLLVKARATVPPDSAGDAAVDAFVRGFAARARSTTCTDGPSNSDGTTLQIRLDVPAAELAPRVEEALRRLGYDPFPLDEPNTWGTVVVVEWPEREPWQKAREGTHPGVELRAQVKDARGGRSELFVSARASCRFAGALGTDGFELVAATELIAEFPEAGKP